jgi:hypothetical protein
MPQTKIGCNKVQYGYIVCAFRGHSQLGFNSWAAWWIALAPERDTLSPFGASPQCASLVDATGFWNRQFRARLRRICYFPAAIKTVAEWFPRRERASHRDFQLWNPCGCYCRSVAGALDGPQAEMAICLLVYRHLRCHMDFLVADYLPAGHKNTGGFPQLNSILPRKRREWNGAVY